MKLVALRGADESGKDTIADYMVKEHGFTKFSFATDMKLAMARLLDIPYKDIDDFKINDEVYIGEHGVKSARQFMRDYANGIRAIFGDDVWAKRTMLEIKGYDKVVLSDLRFQPEAKLVRPIGKIWAVLGRGTGDNGDVPFDTCDAEIENGGPLENTLQQVDDLIRRWPIIWN